MHTGVSRACSKVILTIFGFTISLRDITGAEDSSNIEKAPVFENLDDLAEIEVPGVLLEVPAEEAGALLEVQTSDLSILSPALGQVLTSHQQLLETEHQYGCHFSSRLPSM